MHAAHEGRGLDAGPADLLAKRRTASALRQLGRYPATGLDASVQRLDDTDVGNAFFAGGLRLGVADNAIREVEELRRELVALLIVRLALALAQAQHVLDALGIFISRVESDAALAAYDLIGGAVRPTEAAGEGRDPLLREFHHYRHRFRDLLEALIAAGDRGGQHLRGLGRECRAGCVDAVDAYVVQGAASMPAAAAEVLRRHLHGEIGG